MLRPAPFPSSPDQLTIEVLAEALGSPVASIDVAVIGGDRGMVGQVARVRSWSTDGTELTPVIAKFAAARQASRASSRRSNAHLRELNFYDLLAQRTPVRVPTVHASWYDGETDEFLLIQDAVDAEDGVDQVNGISPTQVAATAHQIAGCHATWWESTELGGMTWLPRLDGPERRNNLRTIVEAGWGPLCDMLSDELTGEERSLGFEMASVLDERMCAVTSAPETLIHSDLRADNLLFDRDGGAVTIIDWQGCGVGPGAWDIAYLVSQSLTVEDRRATEVDLLEGYLDAMASQGVVVDRSAFMDTYALSLVFGLAVATSLPLIGDRSELRLSRLAASMARRSIEAMRDHGVLW
jgi:hypothetical protein